MSTFLQTLGSTKTSPLDMSHGEQCWLDLVASCYASKSWADDDELIIDPVADAIPSEMVAEECSDFFDEPYQSFDWSEEDEMTRSSVADTRSASSLDLKFVGRYMDTILEETEEEQEQGENEMEDMSEGAEDLHSETCTDIATPPRSLTDENRSTFRISTIEPIDELLDDTSPSHVSFLKTLGLYDGYMRRRPITIKLPFEGAKLSRSRHRDGLDILAWVASTQKYASSSHLESGSGC